MQTIDCSKMTEAEFRAVRQKRLGSSDLGVVAGLYGSRLRLYLEKTGHDTGFEATEEMRAGLGLEAHIAAEYCRTTGRTIQASQQLVANEWRHATIDAICTDGRYCEWKAVGSRTAARLDPDGDPDSLPEGWMLQVHQGMDLLENGACDVCVFVGPELKTRVYTVTYRASLAKTACELGHQFWFDHVVPQIPPAEFAPGDLDVIKRAFRGETGHIEVWGEEELEIAINAEWHRQERLKHEAYGKEEGEKEDELRAQLLYKLGNAAGAELPDGWSLRRKMAKRKGYVVESKTLVDFKIIKPKGEK